MFSLGKCRYGCQNVFYKNKPLVLDFVNCKCTSDINIVTNKHYIRLELSDSLLQFVQELDSFCKREIFGYRSMIDQGSILVKLPYRYKRYEIDFNNLSGSDVLVKDSVVSGTLEGVGVFQHESAYLFSFKLSALS